MTQTSRRNRMQVDRSTRGDLSALPANNENGEAPETFNVLKKQAFNAIAVDHRPALCPNCGSCDNVVIKTTHPTTTVVERIHRCKRKDICGITFHSIQSLSRVDVERN